MWHWEHLPTNSNIAFDRTVFLYPALPSELGQESSSLDSLMNSLLNAIQTKNSGGSKPPRLTTQTDYITGSSQRLETTETITVVMCRI